MTRRYLAYGFGISIALHALLVPFVHTEPTRAEEAPPDYFDVTRIPTPPPTPHPTPTPHATPTPEPTTPPRLPQSTPASNRLPIKIRTQHQTARNGGRTEDANAHTNGVANGDPNADRTGAPAATEAPAAAPPTPHPTPTPRPTPTPQTCSRPNIAATTVRALEPDLPLMAQQQGITGTVEVVVALDASSRIVATRVQSSPSVVLNGAALAAARGSQFKTEIRNCEPVAAEYLFSVEFQAQ